MQDLGIFGNSGNPGKHFGNFKQTVEKSAIPVDYRNAGNPVLSAFSVIPADYRNSRNPVLSAFSAIPADY